MRPRNGPPEAVSTSSVHGARRLGADQLVERGVLGVDRHHPRVGRLGQRGDQLAADHQALLVGERDVDALGERDDRRAEPGGADDPVQDQVGAGGGDQLADALLAGEDARRPRLLGAARRRPRRRARPRARRARAPARAAPPSSSRRRGRRPASSSEAPITSSACVADRAGRAEDQDLLHRAASVGTQPQRRRKASGRPEGLQPRPRRARSAAERRELVAADRQVAAVLVAGDSRTCAAALRRVRTPVIRSVVRPPVSSIDLACPVDPVSSLERQSPLSAPAMEAPSTIARYPRERLSIPSTQTSAQSTRTSSRRLARRLRSTSPRPGSPAPRFLEPCRSTLSWPRQALRQRGDAAAARRSRAAREAVFDEVAHRHRSASAVERSSPTASADCACSWLQQRAHGRSRCELGRSPTARPGRMPVTVPGDAPRVGRHVTR